MRITMLGTGHAVVTECYNTCFVLSEGERGMLVDGGGGSGIVTQMKRAGIAWSHISDIFVTHKHIDHLLGVAWALRMLCMDMRRSGPERKVVVHANDQVITLLRHMAYELLHGPDLVLLDTRVTFDVVAPGETRELLGHPTAFWDMGAPDCDQLGFVMEYAPGKRLACCGDVALREGDYERVREVEWLLHESFCLSDHPAATFIARARHSTVAQAAAIAQHVGAHNLVLYHTEDGDLAHRAHRYTTEAREHFDGAIHVPEDLASWNL